MELVLELAAPNRLATRAVSERVTGLKITSGTEEHRHSQRPAAS